jgi:hypothetical protein
MFDKFINEFCKVEFLCYAGEPNWIGWVVIGFISFIVVIAVFGVFLTVVDTVVDKLRR